jgi:hypothetical protein
MTPWAGDQLVARPLYLYINAEKRTHTQILNIHALSGIRTHDPGFRASEDSACLRPLGYRDRQAYRYYIHIVQYINYFGFNAVTLHGRQGD